MEATILRTAATFILLFLFVTSDASIAVNPSSEAIQASRKLNYQENEIVFSPLLEKDAAGDIPIVNPTIPGTSPIINPTTPQPPTAPTPIIPEPPATTTPIIPEPPATTPPIIPEPPATTTPTTPGSTSSTSGGSWCIANPGASQTALQVALDYACGYGGADCAAIQPGAPCYDPATLRDHASYAFNSYYHKNPIPTSCAFGGSAQLTTTDPSHGSCQFTASSSSSTPTTPPKTTTPTIPMTPTVPMTPPTPTFPMTPPSINTPVAPYTPGGNGGSDPTGFDNGLEPTGTPSSAGNISVNLLMLVIINCLVCQLLQPTISTQMGI